MIVKLNQLAPGTEFDYANKKYRTTSAKSQSFLHQAFKGLQEKDCKLVACEPYFGGQFQHNLMLWFNLNTEVEIN